MRTDCKHYESRTYPSGDTMRRCRLDLAPEAPWRCPPDCPAFERRATGAGWTVGSLVEGPVQDAPAAEGVAELLDAAEDIVNAVGPETRALVERERTAEGRWWRRFLMRRRRQR